MRDETARDGSAMLNSTSRPMDLVVTALVMLTMSGTLAEETQTRWPAVKLLSVSGFPRGDSRQASGLVANLRSFTNRLRHTRSRRRSGTYWTPGYRRPRQFHPSAGLSIRFR